MEIDDNSFIKPVKPSKKLVNLDSSDIQIDAVKKAEDEDCIIVRMHECRGGRCVANFTSDYSVKQIIPCNLLEHNIGEAVNDAKCELVFRPFEIKTLFLIEKRPKIRAFFLCFLFFEIIIYTTKIS